MRTSPPTYATYVQVHSHHNAEWSCVGLTVSPTIQRNTKRREFNRCQLQSKVRFRAISGDLLIPSKGPKQTCLDRSDQRQDHHPHQYHAPRNATPPSPDAGSVRDATHVLDVLTYIFLIYLQRPRRAGCRNQHLKFACFGPEPIYIVYIYIIPMCIYIRIYISYIYNIIFVFEFCIHMSNSMRITHYSIYKD